MSNEDYCSGCKHENCGKFGLYMPDVRPPVCSFYKSLIDLKKPHEAGGASQAPVEERIPERFRQYFRILDRSTKYATRSVLAKYCRTADQNKNTESIQNFASDENHIQVVAGLALKRFMNEMRYPPVGQIELPPFVESQVLHASVGKMEEIFNIADVLGRFLSGREMPPDDKRRIEEFCRSIGCTPPGRLSELLIKS